MRLKVAEYSVIYALGALGYCVVEILWRGYSHWSMTVTGGICFMMVYYVNDSLSQNLVWVKSLISAVAVTLMELAVGCVVNLVLGWNVWDYSDRHISLLGQICLEYFILWYLLCIPATLISEQIKTNIVGGKQETA